jgi:hypothetical protein
MRRLEHAIATRGLSSRVRLIGRIDDRQMLEHLARCRAVCFPPYDEDYGFVTVEAFASRKAVITCTDSGGPAELVSDNVNGRVLRPSARDARRRPARGHGRHTGSRAYGAGRLREGVGHDMAQSRAAVDDAVTTRPGVIASALLGILLLAFALSVNFPKANGSAFKGDESTYYVLGLSLARDFDFQFERKDLVRVWEEYSGPQGIFLKRGKDVEIRGSSSFPFFQWQKREDPERDTRLYISKSYIYPLVAAPFRVPVRHERVSGVARAAARLRSAGHLSVHPWATRSNWVALPFALAFLGTSVVPVYFVWLVPELFNFSLVLYAVFFWAYKEVARDQARSLLAGRASDYIAAVLIGVATFSKPPHLLVLGPMLLLAASRRQWSTRSPASSSALR